METSRSSVFDEFVRELDHSLFAQATSLSSPGRTGELRHADCIVDLDLGTSRLAFAVRLRAMADSIEAGRPFLVQIGGREVRVPAGAGYRIAIERDERDREIQFQIHWLAANPHPTAQE